MTVADLPAIRPAPPGTPGAARAAARTTARQTRGRRARRRFGPAARQPPPAATAATAPAERRARADAASHSWAMPRAVTVGRHGPDRCRRTPQIDRREQWHCTFG